MKLTPKAQKVIQGAQAALSDADELLAEQKQALVRGRQAMDEVDRLVNQEKIATVGDIQTVVNDMDEQTLDMIQTLDRP